MNLKLTLTKALVVGGLAALGVTVADVQMASAWWAGLVVVAIELARDLIKTRFGQFVPNE